MKGDFSRITFNPGKAFSQVLQQQGRVLLDADYNEQAAIAHHYMRQLAADVIGPHGGPKENLGFAIERCDERQDFWIGPGRYYIQGCICENHQRVRYQEQVAEDDGSLWKKSFWLGVIYLELRERVVSACEDPSLKEPALRGADSARRLKLDWQVKIVKWKRRWRRQIDLGAFAKDMCVSDRTPPLLVASVSSAGDGEGAGLAPVLPGKGYHGPENQLYRVEIHGSGEASTGQSKAATFKWSRENGSVEFRVREAKGSRFFLENSPFRERMGLDIGNIVEILNEALLRDGRPGALRRIKGLPSSDDVDPYWLELDEDPKIAGALLIRRWDQEPAKTEYALEVREGQWMDLEDGLRIRFEANVRDTDEEDAYRSGDYWLIPARTPGQIDWPEDKDHNPTAVPASRMLHVCAPLATAFIKKGFLTCLALDQRRSFKALARAGWFGAEEGMEEL